MVKIRKQEVIDMTKKTLAGCIMWIVGLALGLGFKDTICYEIGLLIFGTGAGIMIADFWK